MALSGECQNRLYNWKFESAQERLSEEEPTGAERELVKALARTFGNSGWFDGNMGTIVSAAVTSLIGDEDDGQ